MNIRHIKTIAGRELSAYFNAPIGTILITIFLLVSAGLFFSDFFLQNQSTLRPFFNYLPWIFLFLIPAVTMRLWAEENKMGTLEPLMAAPVTPTEAVLGKFSASLIFVGIALFCSGILPLTLFFVGQPDWGAVAMGYLGALLLAGFYLSVGLFISSLTDNQIVAFTVSALVIFIFLAMGEDIVLFTAPEAAAPVLKYMAAGLHFKSILRGVVDSRDIFYYVLMMSVFLHFNVMSLFCRKWR